MAIQFDTLEIGHQYGRPTLAKLWGYESYRAFAKGVFTPKNLNVIALFVTKEKQDTLTQYNDYIDGNYLFWEGENQHGSDRRIIQAREKGTQIYLFYREIHHTDFVYFGEVVLVDFSEQTSKPSEFLFEISIPELQLPASQPEVPVFDRPMLEATETEVLTKSRLGQGRFRKDVIRLWGSCAVTGFQKITVLKASHIKPWNLSVDQERLDPYNGFLLLPNFDTLFDLGLISFENNGKMITSNQVEDAEKHILNIRGDSKLRRVFPENAVYLEHHRNNVFLG
jgi:putative restriction endonuclease